MGRWFNMKWQGTIFLTVLFAAGPAAAQPTTNAPPSATAITVQKPEFHWFAQSKTKRTRENLRPIEGMDTRAWTTVVGWHPGESAFPSAETHQGGWPLFWVNF